MPFRSEPSSKRHRLRPTPFVLALIAVAVLVPVGSVAADVISTSRFVVLEGDVQAEDAYVASSSGAVAGTIEGDLVIATPRLTISGVVTGDVLVMSQGTVSIEGRIDGSLRGVANSVRLTGSVGDDVAVVALDLEVAGTVGRDVVVLGNTATISGDVGRDVLGRVRSLDVAGDVGRDVDVTVDTIALRDGAQVGGGVVYQSANEVDLEPGADVGGQVIALPARAPFFLSLVLTIVFLLGVLGFLVSGIAVLWLLPRTSQAAMAAITERPLLVTGVGLASVIAVPLLAAILIATLVGIPIAVLLLFTAVIAVIVGTVPTVTTGGALILRGRGGAVGGFLLGGTLFVLAVTLLPIAGSLVAAAALIVGVGAWIVGAWSVRDGSAWPVVPGRSRPD